ncbi:hypothetical protein Tco_0748164 [Tanacetum coccineum]|uniref:Uncharacterized protein n=1 Tax=Tanacetum coccineum TaxID=301880 RepID=A0ABQ4YY96_9ASTR
MPTEMELTLEQTQQGVSYEVSNIRVISFTMKMEILLESTSNKLMVGQSSWIRRKLKDGGEDAQAHTLTYKLKIKEQARSQSR